MINKEKQRLVARAALEKIAADVRLAGGQGVLPGARLQANYQGKDARFSVRTSHRRILSFVKMANGKWRGMAADYIFSVVPSQKQKSMLEVFLFRVQDVREEFDRAFEDPKRPRSGNDLPIFVRLDKNPRRDVGHGISNLKTRAIWSDTFDVSDALQAPREESLVTKLKREIAEKNNVDISKVVIEIKFLV